MREAGANWPVSRRSLLAALPLAAGCATQAAPMQYVPPQGLVTPSESVMVSMADPDAGIHFSARLCRYPAFRTAWLWVHAHTPDGFFAFVDHLAPSGGEATPEDGVRVVYEDDQAKLRFERLGSTLSPQCASLRSRVSGADGATLAADLQFAPTLLRSGLLPGRMEAFGRVEGELSISGRRYHLAGPGQFHEQRQTEPRFTTPFAFASLWDDETAMTLLAIPDQSAGYILQAGEEVRSGLVRFGPPGERRALRIDFGPDDFLEGEASASLRYTIPIYGEAWRGAFVTADIGGRRLHGAVNDWRPELMFPGA